MAGGREKQSHSPNSQLEGVGAGMVTEGLLSIKCKYSEAMGQDGMLIRAGTHSISESRKCFHIPVPRKLPSPPGRQQGGAVIPITQIRNQSWEVKGSLT